MSTIPIFAETKNQLLYIFDKHAEKTLGSISSSDSQLGPPDGTNRFCDNEQMLVTDIDHVQLAAPRGCEAEARRFFGRLLGLAEIEKPEPLRTRGGCWFKVGARQLHIGIADRFQPATKAHPAFAVSDIDALFSTLDGEGVRCTWDDTLEGVRRFYANDPWGNRLEFTEPTFP